MEINKNIFLENEKEETKHLEVQSTERGSIGGGKDISFFGGISLLVNNLTGPALVTIPIIYQQAGWFTPTIVMLFIMIVSSLSASMLCEAITKISGNESFKNRVEYATVARHFLSRWAFILTMVLFAINAMSIIVSSIVVSAQTMDDTLIAIFKKTFALEFFPQLKFLSVTNPGNNLSPFGNCFVLSLGYFIVLLITIPMGYFNLDDNIIIQNGAFTLLILIIIEWFINFFLVGLNLKRVPFFSTNQSQVLGTIIFNYAFTTTVPSWVNEKKEKVSINKTIWSSTGIATIFYIAIGLFGAWAYNFSNNEDLLDAINNNSTGALHIISKICVYLFPAVALLSTIPVYCIIIRYNLIENKLCSKPVANFWGVIFPWIISIFFYTGAGLIVVINWASLLVNGFVNFIIPIIIYLISIKKTRNLELYQQELPLEVDQSIEKILNEERTHYVIPKKLSWIHPSILAIMLIIITTSLLLLVIGLNIALSF
jgi:amino acid permease